MRVFLTLLEVFFLASCTSPISPIEARRVGALSSAEGESSSVTITRDAGMFGSACTFHIEIDGREVGRLDPGEKFTTKVEPGRHEVKASNSNWCGGGVEYYTLESKAELEALISVGSSGQVIVIRHDRDVPFQ